MFRAIRSRNLGVLLLDVALAAASLPVALFLRWGRDFTIYSAGYLDWGTALCALLCGLSFLVFHTHKGLWRYISLHDLVALAKAVTLALIVFYLALFLINRLELMPRSVPPIHWLVLLAMLSGPRFLLRASKDRTLALRPQAVDAVPVLLLGASDEAEMFIRESQRNASFGYRVVGVVSSDANAEGRRLHDIRVFAGMDKVEEVVAKLAASGKAPQRLIIAEPYPEGEWVAQMLKLAEKQGLTLARLPQLTDFQSGEASGALQVRPVAVEDVLGRPQTRLDRDAMQGLVAGKRVLVTGAGGSIGSELVRQLAALQPAEIQLLELSEYALYRIDRELGEMYPALTRGAIVGDVRARDALTALFTQHQPEIVFHAAAIKHVPLAESNVEETVLTNVLGTQQVADACMAAGVQVMVQISTDKAVNPTNVMGATKRLAESYCQALGNIDGNNTRFVTVRFGNVLGSTGSVVPLFQHQLEQGGPITVTHPEMTRYFMTIREAVELVIQAAAMPLKAADHQQAPIFVLDMGTPIKIVDLAKQMIRLAGLRHGQDIAIEYSGLRPGEKLHEELFHADEALSPTAHPSIHIAKPRTAAHDALAEALRKLYVAVDQRDTAAARTLLHALVPEFNLQA